MEYISAIDFLCQKAAELNCQFKTRKATESSKLQTEKLLLDVRILVILICTKT